MTYLYIESFEILNIIAMKIRKHYFNNDVIFIRMSEEITSENNAYLNFYQNNR